MDVGLNHSHSLWRLLDLVHKVLVYGSATPFIILEVRSLISDVYTLSYYYSPSYLQIYTIACEPLNIPPTKVLTPYQEYKDQERSNPARVRLVSIFYTPIHTSSSHTELPHSMSPLILRASLQVTWMAPSSCIPHHRCRRQRTHAHASCRSPSTSPKCGQQASRI